MKFRSWDNKLKRMSDPEDIAIQADGTIMIRVGGLEYGDRDNKVEASNQILMQYINKKDKGDIDIYDKDIIEYTDHNGKVFKSVVEWSDYECGWRFNLKGLDYLWDMDGLIDPWDEVKVIGNIFNNPEEVLESYC